MNLYIAQNLCRSMLKCFVILLNMHATCMQPLPVVNYRYNICPLNPNNDRSILVFGLSFSCNTMTTSIQVETCILPHQFGVYVAPNIVPGEIIQHVLQMTTLQRRRTGSTICAPICYLPQRQ